MTPIEHVSDTARWVAVYRAMETERADAIFRDPYARRLAGAKGEEIVQSIKRGRSMAWPIIVRTAVFDEIILRAVTRDKADLVINLAAGLDTRPWRLELPAPLRWVDVDLPAILAHKTDALRGERPRCRYEAVPTDLADTNARRALFTRLGAESARTLVVTEGLLVYLTPAQVSDLARDLHAEPAFQWWLIDIGSPRLLKLMSRTWGRSVQQGGAPFQFAPAEGTDFFRPLGWRELEYRSTADEAQRLKRGMPLMWLWRFLARLRGEKGRAEFRRFAGFVLLGRE